MGQVLRKGAFHDGHDVAQQLYNPGHRQPGGNIPVFADQGPDVDAGKPALDRFQNSVKLVLRRGPGPFHSLPDGVEGGKLLLEFADKIADGLEGLSQPAAHGAEYRLDLGPDALQLFTQRLKAGQLQIHSGDEFNKPVLQLHKSRFGLLDEFRLPDGFKTTADRFPALGKYPAEGFKAGQLDADA